MGKTLTLLKSTNSYVTKVYVYDDHSHYYDLICSIRTDAGTIIESPPFEITDLCSIDDNLENCLHYVLSNQLFNNKKYSDDTPFVTYTEFSKQKIRTTQVKTLKTHRDDQLERLNGIIAAILTPFSPADKKKNDALFDLLSQARKTRGETPLHCALKWMVSPNRFQSLFDRISELTPTQKKTLITLQDSDGKNLLHLALNECDTKMFKSLLGAFGEEAIKTASDQRDHFGNTPLHTLCSPGTTRGALFGELPASITSHISLTKENTSGENALHTACKSKEDKLVDLMCKKLEGKAEEKEGKSEEKELDITIPDKTKAIKKQTTDGLNVAHYAAQSGSDKIFERILEGISPEDKQIIATQEDKRGWTLLHYACRYGSTHMITQVITMQGLVGAHRIARITSPDALKKLLSENTNGEKSSIVFDEILSKTTRLMDAYHYLINRFQENDMTQSRIDDKNKRLEDFIQVIQSKKEDKLLPSTPGFRSSRYFCGLFQLGSERYHHHRAKLQRVTSAETEQFIAHLRQQQQNKCEIADSIIKSIDSKGPPMPSAPSAPLRDLDDEQPGSTTTLRLT